jgi:hypothetical protein
MAWTDPTLTPNVTPIKKVHFIELRTQVKEGLNGLTHWLRILADVKTWALSGAGSSRYGSYTEIFPSDNWTPADATAGLGTEAPDLQMITYEIRAVVDFIYDSHEDPLITWTDLVIDQDDPVYTTYIQELRDEIGESGENLPYRDPGKNMIGFFETIPPAPFEILDGAGGNPDFRDTMVRMSTGEGSPTGSNIHSSKSHGSFLTSTVSIPGRKSRGGSTYAYDRHKHYMNAHNHGDADHRPPFISVAPAKNEGRVVKAGMILWYRGSTPPEGWGYVTNGHGRFLYLTDTSLGTTGGATRHYHPNSNPGTSGATSTQDDRGWIKRDNFLRNHSHSSTHNAYGDATPPYVKLLLIKALSDDSRIPKNAVTAFLGSSIPEGWWKLTGEQAPDGIWPPDWTQRFMIGWNTEGEQGVLGGSETHSDQSSPFYTGYRSDYYYRDAGRSGSLSRRSNHRHYVNGHSHGTGNSIPRYVELLVCYKYIEE